MKTQLQLLEELPEFYEKINSKLSDISSPDNKPFPNALRLGLDCLDCIFTLLKKQTHENKDKLSASIKKLQIANFELLPVSPTLFLVCELGDYSCRWSMMFLDEK